MSAIGVEYLVLQLRVQAVFPPGDLLDKLPRLEIHAQRTSHILRRLQRLIASDQPDALGPFGEKVQTNGMEGPDGHPMDRPPASQPLLQPFPELPRGLIGKGHSGDLAGPHAPLLYQIGDAGHQGLGLARTRPRNYLHRPCLGGHGFPLFRVEAFAGGRCVHRLRHPLGRFGRPASVGRRRLPQAKKAHLAVQRLPFRGLQQADHAIGSVIAGHPAYLSLSQPADPLCHQGTGHLTDVRLRHLPQDVKFRPQLPQHALILTVHLAAGG